MVTRDHGLSICEHVGCKWKSVLRHLDMEETAIENVDLENKYVSEKFLQGLLQWMRNVGSQKATTRTLCNALREAGCSVKALEKFKISKRGTSKKCERDYGSVQTVTDLTRKHRHWSKCELFNYL